MTDDDTNPQPPQERRSRLRGLLVALVVIVGGLGLVLLVGRWQMGRLGQRELRATVAKLDADDPGWRLDALLAERAARAPKGADDAAPRVLEVAARVPADWGEWQQQLPLNDWIVRHPTHVRPPAATLDAVRDMAARTHVLRAEALKLADAKGGVFPITHAANPLDTRLPHLDQARRVVGLLQLDGDWEALHGNPNRGVAAARAILGVARTIGDEPLLVSQLVRMACAHAAARTALQALAWGEPTEGLTELQAELLAEADTPWFLTGMRGERAMLDRVFQGLDDGSIPPESAFQFMSLGKPGPQHHALLRAYRALLPEDRARCLKLCTAYLEAAKLPYHEQFEALRRIERPTGPRNMFTRLLTPACESFATAALRTRADLLTAATGVACERFRRKHGRFPNALGELVPAFLPAVPQSPFDGTPLRYRVHDDRVVIHCVWPDGPFRFDDLPDDLRDGLPPQVEGRPTGLSVGFRLWVPKQRGLDPPEPKADPAPEAKDDP